MKTTTLCICANNCSCSTGASRYKSLYHKEVIITEKLALPAGREKILIFTSASATALVTQVNVLEFSNIPSCVVNSFATRKAIIEFELYIRLIYRGAKYVNELFLFEHRTLKAALITVSAMVDGLFFEDIIQNGNYRLALYTDNVNIDKINEYEALAYLRTLISLTIGPFHIKDTIVTS